MIDFVMNNIGMYLLLSGQALFVIGSCIEKRLPSDFSMDKYDHIEHKFGAFGLDAVLCAISGGLLTMAASGFAAGLFISIMVSLPAVLLQLSSYFLK